LLLATFSTKKKRIVRGHSVFFFLSLRA